MDLVLFDIENSDGSWLVVNIVKLKNSEHLAAERKSKVNNFFF